MSAAHAARWIIASGMLLVALGFVVKPKQLTYAFAYAIVTFGLAVSQLLGFAKDMVSGMDGLALIVVGIASGLFMGESIRRYLAEKREQAAQSFNPAPNKEKA